MMFLIYQILYHFYLWKKSKVSSSLVFYKDMETKTNTEELI